MRVRRIGRFFYHVRLRVGSRTFVNHKVWWRCDGTIGVKRK